MLCDMIAKRKDGYVVVNVEKRCLEQQATLMKTSSIRVDAVDDNIITCERQDLIMNTNEPELDVTTKTEILISIIDEDE